MSKLLSLTPITKAPGPLYRLMVRCTVTPASRGREGIRRVSDEHVYIHVGAEPRKGQANDAVCRVLAEALGVPRSDVTVQGKNREKLVHVENLHLARDTEQAFLQDVRAKLETLCQTKDKR